MLIQTAYDRSGLIQRAIDTLKRTITEEIVIVSIVCFIFLLHLRSAIVAIISLPLGVLISLVLQYHFNINANILSLAGIAIAIGAMVDASVVMVENAHKHIEHAPPDAPREPLILEAAKEVGPSLFFAILVLTVSFLPIFALTGETGRLFRPLAFTKTFAMGGSAILAITLIPILMIYFIRGKIIPDMENPVARATMVVYKPVVRWIMRFPKTAILLAIIAMAATVYPFLHLGSEFMPPLDEGDLLYMPTTMPGISITEAKNVLQQTDRIIRTFPEVEYVFGKAGRAETATDPAPLSMIETTIRLKDREHWRPVPTWYSSWAPEWLKGVLRHFTSDRISTEKLIREMDAAVKFPGLANSWGYPIKIRIDMLSTGIKTPVGLKFLGPDLDVLNRLAVESEAILKNVPGTASVFAERVTGGYYLDFEIKRREAARYGLTVGDVQEVITSAMGGENITKTVEGLERYPVNLRYFQDYRQNLPALRRLLIPTPDGSQVPMEQVADIKVHQGPDMIKSEGSRRSAWVFVDLHDIDVGTYVKKAKEVIQARLQDAGGLLPHLERPVRIHGGRQKTPPNHHPLHPGPGLPAPLPEHPLPRQGGHRHAGRALFPAGGHLASLPLGLQPQRRGGGGDAGPGRPGRRDRGPDAPLPGYRPRPVAAGRPPQHRSGPARRHRTRRGDAGAPQTHDHPGQPVGPAAHHVGQRHRLGGGQTHRRPHGGGRGHLLPPGTPHLSRHLPFMETPYGF